MAMAVSTPTEHEFLTVTEVARRLRVTNGTVLRWIYAGRISAIKLSGGRAGWRIPSEDIERLIEESRYESR
jgi:excisionase family DNA binding protein